jgi:hypothetical protein
MYGKRLSRFIHDSILQKKEVFDDRMHNFRGGFEARTPKDLKNVFDIDYRKTRNLKSFEVPNLKHPFDRPKQEFLIKSILNYNNTYPSSQRLSSDSNPYPGSSTHLRSHLEHFLRTMILVSYQEGVYLENNYKLVHSKATKESYSEYVILLNETPGLVLRVAPSEKREIRGNPLELAFVSNLFELYTYFWEMPQMPVYGCVTDLDYWIFLKYDGDAFYRADKVYKYSSNPNAVLGLATKFYGILESQINNS